MHLNISLWSLSPAAPVQEAGQECPGLGLITTTETSAQDLILDSCSWLELPFLLLIISLSLLCPSTLQHPQLFSLVFMVGGHFCMDKQLSFNEDLCLYVVVQFYSWFKFYFLLFQTHYHAIIIHCHTQKQKKPKNIWIKDKIEPPPRVVAKVIACCLKRKWRQQKEGGIAPSLPTLGTVWVFSSVSYRSLVKIQQVIASDSAG